MRWVFDRFFISNGKVVTLFCVGRALKDAGVNPTYVYSSCAYRCVQTAVGLIKGRQCFTV